jgi:hypothetical protein
MFNFQGKQRTKKLFLDPDTEEKLRRNPDP